MRQAVLGGSAMAALTAMRSGVMDEDLERAMPFSDLSVPFRIVLGGAEQGDPFCQMVIGNVYYWWDFLRIEQRGAGDFPDDDASRLYLRSRFLQCESWYLSSFRAGCAASGTNLIRLYSEGEKDLVPPRPEKELELDRLGAELGFPNYQYFYACDLCGDGREEEGYALHRTAAERGEPRAFYWAGYAWEYGLGGPKDEACAAEYYRHGIRASYIKTTPVISGWASCATSARASRRTMKKRFSFSKKPTNCPTRIRPRTISASAAPSATARSRTTPPPGRTWSASTGIVPTRSTSSAGCTATAKAARKTSTKASPSSGKQAISPKRKKSFPTTGRPSSPAAGSAAELRLMFPAQKERSCLSSFIAFFIFAAVCGHVQSKQKRLRRDACMRWSG